jgi:hypothetical protein
MLSGEVCISMPMGVSPPIYSASFDFVPLGGLLQDCLQLPVVHTFAWFTHLQWPSWRMGFKFCSSSIAMPLPGDSQSLWDFYDEGTNMVRQHCTLHHVAKYG